MSTSKFKLEVGKFYKMEDDRYYAEIVYKDPVEMDYPYLVLQRCVHSNENSATNWYSVYGMSIFSLSITEEIPNPRMTSTTPTTVGTNWLSPLTDFYRKTEEARELLGKGLISEEKALSIMNQCQRQLEAEEDGWDSNEEYLDNLLEEEKKRFQLEIGKKYTMSNHPVNKYVLIEHYVSSGYYALCFYGTIVNNSGTCSGHFRKDGTYAGFCDNKYNLVAEYAEPISGSALAEILLRIDQEEIENKKICQHEWVDTGFHKSWCKKCDVDRPEGDNVTNDTQVTTNGRLS